MKVKKARLLLAALSVMALSVTTAYSSAADEPQPTTQPVVTPAAPTTLKPARNNCQRMFTQRQFKRYAPKVYYRDKVSMKARKHMRLMVRCQHSDRAEHKMRKMRHRLAAERTQRLRMARLARSLTPYHCSTGDWAIPCDIIDCESGGSWTAHNPKSPARGPYQLLGHGEPWPVRTEADKLAHHRIAAKIWNGGRGRGAWEC